MNKIKEVKERVDIIKVAQYLGINLNRANKCKCLWHEEKTASLSFSQSKQIFHCFGCGIGGDCITLVSKVLNINAYESAKLLNEVFGLGIDFGKRKTSWLETNRYIQEQKAIERFYKWHNETLQMLCDYLLSLEGIKKLQQQDIIDYFIDLLIFGTENDWLWFKKTEERWCKEIGRKLKTRNIRRISTV